MNLCHDLYYKVLDHYKLASNQIGKFPWCHRSLGLEVAAAT